jgi:putative acetyltransferase
VGRAIIDYILAWARRSTDLRRITLWVLARNTRAVQLYERCGWQIEGHMRGDMVRDGEYLDTYYMALWLDAQLE